MILFITEFIIEIDIMEISQASVADIVWFYAPSKVLICLLCGSGVRPGGKHFRS